MILIDIHERKMLKADSFDSFYTDAIFLYKQECNDNTFLCIQSVTFKEYGYWALFLWSLHDETDIMIYKKLQLL